MEWRDRLIVFDLEVTAYNWLAVFKDYKKNRWYWFWEDQQSELKQFLAEKAQYSIFGGFNNKRYDNYVLQQMCVSDVSVVKDLNDWIIANNLPWEYPYRSKETIWFDSTDIRDDMYEMLGLKTIEGFLCQNIKESDVSFDIDRPLTDAEKEEMLAYCKWDVQNTERVFKLREDYLDIKVSLADRAGISPEEALRKTEANLTALILGGNSKRFNDDTCYVIPEKVQREYIRDCVWDYIYSICKKGSLEEESTESCTFSIGDCKVVIGLGGIHAAIPKFHFIQSEEPDYMCLNFDVSSYYPHLMILYDYISRACRDRTKFPAIVSERMQAKAQGLAIATGLKNVVNKTYGAMRAKYNPLYDPLNALSVCLSGELFLCELAEHLYKDIPDLIIPQLNTDGICIKFPKQYLDDVLTIINKWQKRTGFTLERDDIEQLWQKDVNNYVLLKTSGKEKRKGGALSRGISTAGAWKINYNYCIVPEAVCKYFLYGVPVRETIEACNDTAQFQFIAHASMSYTDPYQLVDGEVVPIQRTNRVYATRDEKYGTLYKIKKDNGRVTRQAGLPDHCIIDNEFTLSIDNVDKEYYIGMAEQLISDFTQKGTKKMAKKVVTETVDTVEEVVKESPAPAKKKSPNLNLYMKLAKAKKLFLEAGTKKSGKHRELMYTYFELEDIIPQVLDIFEQLDLLGITTFDAEKAYLSIYDATKPEDEPITVSVPMKYAATNKMINEVQALGSSITYIRRYLYMILLDIIEADSIENAPKPKEESESPAVAAKANKPLPVAPKTTKVLPVQAKAPAVTKEMVVTTDTADEIQVEQIKTLCKKLITAKPDKKPIVKKLMEQTNNFTTLNKAKAAELITKLKALNEGE